MLNGALMIVRLTLEGALKWALRDFLLEEWRASIEGQLSDRARFAWSLTEVFCWS